MATMATASVGRTCAISKQPTTHLPRAGLLSFRSRLTQARGLQVPSRVARGRLDREITAVATGAAAVTSAAGPPKSWEAEIVSNGVLDEDDAAGENIQVVVLDGETGAQSGTIDISTIKWDKKPSKAADGLFKGWSRKGTIALPAGIKPSAVLVTKLPTPPDPKKPAGQTLDFISTLTLKSDGGEVTFPIHSWISPDHGARVFFGGSTLLPKDTPKPLAELRTKELEGLRGEPTKPTDRVYGYQVWNDLGKPDMPRITLGFDGKSKLPYPRHMPNIKAPGDEVGQYYVPLDEQFGFSKQQQLGGDGLLGQLNAFAATLAMKLKLRDTFKSFADVFDAFRADGGWDAALSGKETASVLEGSDAPPGKSDVFGYALKKAIGGAWKQIVKGVGLSAKFPEPRLIVGRHDVWNTDEEWGRLFLAGIDPCGIFALKFLPEKAGSAIKPEHVDAEIKALGGKSLAEHVADTAAGGKPRLFMVDYFALSAFWADLAKEDKPNRVEHCGRVVLFLKQDAQGNDTALIPVAIELKNKSVQGLPPTAGLVYSRQALAHDPKKKVLWDLAKAVFRSLDAIHHQLISHWLRTHVCIEPFIIATHRQLSALHPVYKLMQPHYRYTLAINATGRMDVFKAGNFVERTYTAGQWANALSAAVYGKTWRFHQQSLPGDLQRRGLVDANNKPWTDYPYADDGLDIYNTIKDYFTSYLKLYYKSNADVAGDAELQAWWAEVKNVGHGDLKVIEPDESKVWGFAGPITNVDQLVTVLTTIAWLSSGHHAAVNFGQYDYLGFLLSISGLVRRPIPSPTDESAPAYKALVEASGKKQEEEFLTYLADPKTQLEMMVVAKGFAAHAPDEHFIDHPNELLLDPAAKALNAKFIENVKALEAKFEARNKDPSRWTRGKGTKESMPYTLLIPSSTPGLTFRGVPYSISV